MTQVIEYFTVDKSSWPAGPWHTEPDKRQWTYAGLPCLIVRNSLGTWCGYVGVGRGHKLFGLEYNQLETDFDVHGGLTFSDHCQPGPESTSICHRPAPGESDDVWWLGFDCAHYGDLSPLPIPALPNGVYRDVGYVTAEVENLALALRSIQRQDDSDDNP